MNDQHHNKDDGSNTALEDTAIDWVVHLRSGVATEADRRAFTTWRERSAAHEAAARFAETLWTDLGETRTLAEPAQIPGSQPQQRPQRHTKQWTRRTFIGVAAAASLAAVVVGSGLFGPISGLGADHVTRTGERREITLPDGSTAWMNSTSALSVSYDGNQRQLHLHAGEGYFTVVRDPARPFRVQAGDVEVSALGTAFSVRRLGGEVQVVVTESAVAVRSPAAEPGFHVPAGKAATVTADGSVRGPAATDVTAATAWTRGKLIFNARPLAELAAELERHQSGRILILDERLRSLKFSGVLPLDDPNAAARILENALDLQLTRLPFLTLIR